MYVIDGIVYSDKEIEEKVVKTANREEEPARLFIRCKICDKMCRNLKALKRHMNGHNVKCRGSVMLKSSTR